MENLTCKHCGTEFFVFSGICTDCYDAQQDAGFCFNLGYILAENNASYLDVHDLILNNSVKWKLRGSEDNYENIWLTEEGHIRILRRIKWNEHKRAKEGIGQLGYAAPEKAVDIEAPMIALELIQVQIDAALDAGNKELFMELTNQLKN
jgi:uncharacterized protein YpiB (UPF0302 family)